MSGAGLSDFRRLGGALAQASADQLARVVSVIDALPDRAEADLILDRVRPTLRGRGVSRPLRFTRLLFAPLDGLIVPAPAWRPGMAAVPRPALSLLARAVRDALGGFAAEIEAACAGRTREDEAALLALGGRLWPAAAVVLPEAAPAVWREAGFAAADYEPVRQRCATAWRHALALRPAQAAAADGPPPELCRDVLSAAVAEGPAAFEVVLRLLLAGAARPAGVAALALEVAPGAGPAVMPAAQRALDDLLASSVERVSAPLPSAPDGGQAAVAAAQAACTLVEDLEASSLLRTPQRREGLLALRQAADKACRRGFSDTLTRGFMQPMACLRRADAADAAAEIERAEDAARSLRKIEAAGRRLGGAETYDRALRSAAEAVAEDAKAGTAPAVGRADALRLTEILLGPDAAERLLGGPRRKRPR
ncbi:hypothetical protein EAH89_03775 [Roseomonas nepalensis]|uniref:Uncharacterized protein n=1 Tax=Muricoccus nepalensis TaxID=1854500 RepID=A0A502GDX4_9PROT|nr:hypothetical protein [Roseomonas nepalensis]TPG60497.1 hypothetical protein EAH89_03775 [Roseomonas nepalensis]